MNLKTTDSFSLFLLNTSSSEQDIDVFGWNNTSSREGKVFSVDTAYVIGYDGNKDYGYTANGVSYSVTAAEGDKTYAQIQTLLNGLNSDIVWAYTVNDTTSITWYARVLYNTTITEIIFETNDDYTDFTSSQGYLGSSLVQVQSISYGDYNSFLRACCINNLFVKNIYLYSTYTTQLTSIFDYTWKDYTGNSQNFSRKTPIDPYQNFDYINPYLNIPDKFILSDYGYMSFTMVGSSELELLIDYEMINQNYKMYHEF